MSHASLADSLRAARGQRGLSLRSVEQSTGVSNAYLSQLENGRIRKPSPVVLHKLSVLYDIAYPEVMRLAGYPVPDSTGLEAGGKPSRALSRFGEISREEERQLAEYLEFIRARQRRRPR